MLLLGCLLSLARGGQDYGAAAAGSSGGGTGSRQRHVGVA